MDRIKKFSKKTFSSLAVRNYRLYFIGQGVSLSGTWMQTIAQGWLVLQITGSGTQLGVIVALQFLPLLIFGPWGGIIADRYNKRALLYYTNGVSAFLSLILSFIVFAGTTQLWELYVIALMMGFVRVVDNPVRQTFLSELVGNAHLKNAVSLNSTVNNLARVIGPTISGILVAGVGIAFCFFINAISFVATIVTLAYMRSDELHIHEPPKKAAQLAQGFRYVASTPLIRDTLIMMTLIGTFVFEFQVSLPIFARQPFGGGAATYALLMSAMGLGSVFGGLFAAGRSSIAPRYLVVNTFLCGLSLLAAASMPTLALALVAMCVVGFFTINVTSLANTMVQLEATPAMRGRVMALWSMAMMGSTPLGGPMVGFVGEYMGGRWGLALGGAAALVAALYGALVHRPDSKLEKIPKEASLHAQKATAEQARRV